VEAYDLSLKLAYAGARSPIPFTTGPEYTNSVPGVPVLAMLRIFLTPDTWSEENVLTVAREVARILGPAEQFDIGITLTQQAYDANLPATGVAARLMKLDPRDPHLILRIADETSDKVYGAQFPRLQFERLPDDSWRPEFTPRAVRLPTRP
jgi:hypothetical protein